ncbi:MAG: hypothetical protein AAF353_02065 [Pseudomonadota bacterium]
MNTHNATFTANEIDTRKLQSNTRSLVNNLYEKLKDYWVRSELERAQARYQMKRKRQESSGAYKDSLNQLSLTQKQQLGLHHLID